MTGVSVLVTGASGYIGGKLVRALGALGPESGIGKVVATDVRDSDGAPVPEGIVFQHLDVRDASAVSALVAEHGIDVVVHLASIVTPGPENSRQLEYEVDVLGTRNVLDACLAAGVSKLIVTSSGAAYGYHADNPAWLDEDDAIRGHEAFAYSRHKRLVEESLAEARREHPELAQLVFRPGTVLGEGVRNQITALFEKPVLLGVIGSASPFVFIWDEDVVACLMRGILEPVTGVFNLAGDGAIPLRDLARRIGKPFLPLPARLLVGALGFLRALRLTRYGPEQVDFLRYRPVLSNRRLKEDFGFTPRKTSSEVFDLFWGSR